MYGVSFLRAAFPGTPVDIPDSKCLAPTRKAKYKLWNRLGPPADPLQAIGHDVINQCDRPAFCLPRATLMSTFSVGEPTIPFYPDT